VRVFSPFPFLLRAPYPWLEMLTTPEGGSRTEAPHAGAARGAAPSLYRVTYERRTEDVEVSAVRPLAAERGSWTRRWTGQTGKGEMRGTYMAMWQVAGEWHIRSELYVLLTCAGPGCPPANAP
jgi:hypothetical protein